MKIFFTLVFLNSAYFLFAQLQVGNSNMEVWDNVASANEEPRNWNGFKSGQGSFFSFASQQVQRSTAIRPGATGQYCARVWSKSTFGIIANGNLTLGRINMGSTSASDPANYNFSSISDTLFSEAMTDSPDSLVFWVKYTSANAGDSARIHAILHDSYDLRDPVDANSAPYVVARAERNYARTNGSWLRISTPFVYSGPSTVPAFLLLTFSTNKIPGGGSNNDEILIDDVELIYNASVSNQEISALVGSVSYRQDGGLSFFNIHGQVEVVNMNGNFFKQGKVSDLQGISLPSGCYIISTENVRYKFIVL